MVTLTNGAAKAHTTKILKSSQAHPLDPLSAEELDKAISLLKSHVAQLAEPIDVWKTTGALLVEPSKAVVLHALGIDLGDDSDEGSTQVGADLARRAEIHLIDAVTGRAYEAQFNLDKKSLERWTPLPEYVQPSLCSDELLSCESVVRADPDIQRLCRDVGVDPKDLRCDGWCVGYEPRFGRSRRLQQGMLYVQSKADDNIYSRPLDFVPTVDSNAQKVIRIDFPDVGANRGSKGKEEGAQTTPHELGAAGKPKDFHEPEQFDKVGPLTRPRVTPPAEALDYLPELAHGSRNPIKMREGLKPLHVVQPEGVSFKMTGRNLEWQGWSLHVGWNYRDGVLLNTVRFEDPFDGQVRPLFHRISLAEMVVPYGEPAWPHPRKHAFDVGEYGLGMMSNSLALGCDCLGAIHYLDGDVIDSSGRVVTIPKCVCIHEEDAGLLFKHTDYRPGGRAHAVRARKLVISMVCTVANYEYGIYYSLHQDGTIGLEVKLTGVLNIFSSGPGESAAPFGSIVAPGINAHYHQHLFSLRLDPVLDGVKNSAVQTDVKMLPEDKESAQNWAGNAFRTEKTIFDKATASDWHQERSWSIVNESKLHYASGLPVGYKIMCRDMHDMLIKEGAPVWRRAPFARHHFWVVPNGDESSIQDQRLYPAGKHVAQTIDAPSDSIQEWVSQGESVRNKDILCFLTFGVTHIPRPEDFPVMPVENVNVLLKPVGFFKYNPALGVPSMVDKRSVPAFEQSHGTNGINGGGHDVPAGTDAASCCSKA